MVNTELAAVMEQPGRVSEWATAIKYKNDLTAEDNEISKSMDAWAKDLGRTGCDPNHELSQLITRAIDRDTVTAPSDLIERMFDSDNVGEFDDYRGEKDPKNTIKVYEATVGGNVDASYIDHSILTPTWTTLQAETFLSLADIRRGGYKTVANLINFINEALEEKKICSVMTAVDTAITNGMAGYVAESTAAPTAASMNALALYLKDMSDGETPLVFALNKYIQAISGLAGVTNYLTDAVKNQWNTNGQVSMYAGCELYGLSGQKKLANGDFIVPNQRVIGIAGKVGKCITKGETQVLQDTDINSEKIHIKVGGYTFGTMYSDIAKVGKVVMAQ